MDYSQLLNTNDFDEIFGAFNKPKSALTPSLNHDFSGLHYISIFHDLSDDHGCSSTDQIDSTTLKKMEQRQ